MSDPMADDEARERLLQQYLGKDRRHYSQGRLSDDDHGDLSLAVAADEENKVVTIHFGKSITWMGMDKNQAIEFANMIIKQANKL